MLLPDCIHTVDYHSGGQPLRIVLEGGPKLEGSTAAARRASAISRPELDAFRTFLCGEPRGHADMYVAYIFESNDPECDFGAVFCHNTGYPPSCGHGVLALAAHAVAADLVRSDRNGETVVTIEIPAGRAVVHVLQHRGIVQGLRVHRGPSYPLLLDQRITTSRGEVIYDLAFSGATFASVDARLLGLSVEPASSVGLVDAAREILHSLNADASDRMHPDDERLSGVFGVILFESLEPEEGTMRQRAVNIFNDGWIERSPGAAMTGARLALLTKRNELTLGERMIQESISGARAIAWTQAAISAEHEFAIFAGVEVSAHRTGEHSFMKDMRDDVEFSLR